MNFKRKLPVPKELKEEYPITEEMGEIVKKRDKAVSDIITGEDDRMLLVIGPCSADHEDPVIDYISRLAKVQEKVKDKIFIVPRIYTNKPRTVGTGYKGMLHQPDPEKGEDMLKGVIAIRNLHIRAIRDTGFTCADEISFGCIKLCCNRCKECGESGTQAYSLRYRRSSRNEESYRW